MAKAKEPGSDELLSVETAVAIQNQMEESEAEEQADNEQFEKWLKEQTEA